MKLILAIFAVFGILLTTVNSEDNMSENVYSFTVKDINGKDVSLADYKGKTILIVNVASKCGFTPQYKGLEELYVKFKDKGLVILGFPCNQFGKQEPGNSEEIKSFCQLNYGVSFPMFEKIDVNGDNAHPLYKYLVKAAPGMITDGIKWNFTKFLIDKDGKVVDRFAPQTTPESLTERIEKMLE